MRCIKTDSTYSKLLSRLKYFPTLARKKHIGIFRHPYDINEEYLMSK